MPEEFYKCWAIAHEPRDKAVVVDFGDGVVSSKPSAREAASIYAERLFHRYGEGWFGIFTSSENIGDTECEVASMLYYGDGKPFRYIDIGVLDNAGREWGYRVKVEGPPHAFYAGQSLW